MASARSPASDHSPPARAAPATIRWRRERIRSVAACSVVAHQASASSARRGPRNRCRPAAAAVRAAAGVPDTSRRSASDRYSSSASRSNQSTTRTYPASLRRTRSAPSTPRRRLARTEICWVARAGGRSRHRQSINRSTGTGCPRPRASTLSSVRTCRRSRASVSHSSSWSGPNNRRRTFCTPWILACPGPGPGRPPAEAAAGGADGRAPRRCRPGRPVTVTGRPATPAG